MSVFTDLRAEWVARLAAAGVDNVTADPVTLPPFVLVDPITVTGTAGVGSWTGTLAVQIVVPPPGDAAALEALEAALELVLVTCPGPASAVPGTWGPNDIPAYTVTYPLTIPNPAC